MSNEHKDRERVQKVILSSIHNGKLNVDELRSGLSNLALTYAEEFAEVSAKAGPLSNQDRANAIASERPEAYKHLKYVANQVLGLVPETKWKDVQKTYLEFASEHKLVAHQVGSPKADSTLFDLAPGFEFTVKAEKAKSLPGKAEKSKPAEANSSHASYKPMEISFIGNPAESIIKRADFPAQASFPGNHKFTNTVLRQNNGSYEGTTGQQGIIQLNIIDDMRESLKENYTRSGTVLIIRGEPVQRLNYEQAEGYLNKLKKLHLDKDHALKEMKDLIKYCSDAGGSIDAEDNAALKSFADQHKMKLKANPDPHAQQKREELVDLVKKKANFYNPDTFSPRDVEEMSTGKLIEVAQKNKIKFDYEEIKGHDQITIQQTTTGKTVVVKGVTISSKDVAAR